HPEGLVVGIERGAVVPVAHRHGMDLAVGAEGPAMVAAAKEAHVAGTIADDLGAAMAASIVEHADRSVGLAHHDDRFAANDGGEVVARVGDLAFVTDDHPGAPEDALHLEVEDRGIDVDRSMDAIGLDQPGKIFDAKFAHGASLRTQSRNFFSESITRKIWEHRPRKTIVA